MQVTVSHQIYQVLSSTERCSTPDNAYYLGDATVVGHRYKTNTRSNTAYRGFGGPQGMMTIEHIMDEVRVT
ncbi:molybdopterin-dependent oxidoreductase [Vibrio lentus]|nr:molybdopterin-dependent oxidoreductase [Vibrio lentus]